MVGPLQGLSISCVEHIGRLHFKSVKKCLVGLVHRVARIRVKPELVLRAPLSSVLPSLQFCM